MRIVFALLLSLVLLTSLAAQSKRKPSRSSAPAAETQGREEEIRAAMKKLDDRDIVAHVSFDVAKLLELWTEDGVLLMPHEAPVIGTDALRKYYERQQIALGSSEILGYEENWEEVRVQGDYAYEWGEVRSRMRTPLGAETVTAMHAVRILKRQVDGSWRVARAIYNDAAPPSSSNPPAGEQR